jgi:hypothetical protein
VELGVDGVGQQSRTEEQQRCAKRMDQAEAISGSRLHRFRIKGCPATFHGFKDIAQPLGITHADDSNPGNTGFSEKHDDPRA